MRRWHLLICAVILPWVAQTAWAGWITAPPSTVNQGTTVNIDLSGSGYTDSNYSISWSLQYQINGGSWTTFATTGNGGGPGSNVTAYLPGGSSNNASGTPFTFSTSGTYNFRAVWNSGSSYTDLPSNLTVTVSNPVTFSVSPTSFTYNGASQGPNANPNPSNASYSTSLTPSAVNAGSYSVQYAGTSGYSGNSGQVSWVINRASISGLNLNAASFTYNGGAQGPSSGASNVSWAGGTSTSYSASGTWSATNAGTYTASATGTGNLTGSASTNWTIYKANQSTPTSAGGAVNVGSTFTAAGSGGGGSGGYSFQLVGGGTAPGGAVNASSGVVSSTGPGTVLFQVMRSGDSNYNASAWSSTYTVTFNAISTSFSVNGPFTYNGSAQSVTITPSPAGASFTSGGTLSATNANTYTATAAAYGNYSGSNSNLNWTINKAPQSISWSSAPSTVYAGSTLSFSATGSATGTYVWSVSPSGPTGISGNGNSQTITFPGAGAYTVSVYSASNSNYLQSNTVSVGVTVASRPTTAISASATTINFGQSTTLTGTFTTDSAHGDTLIYTIFGANNANISTDGGVTYNGGAWSPQPNYFSWYTDGRNPHTSVVTPLAAGSYTFYPDSYTSWTPSWVDWNGVSATITVNLTTPSASFANGAKSPQSGATYTCQASDLNAAFSNPYSGSVAAPTGTVTYTISPNSTNGTVGSAVTAGTTTFTAGLTYIVRASYPGNANYNSTTVDSTWTINKASEATLTLNAGTPQTFGTGQTLSTSGGSGTGAASYAIVGQSAAGVATLSGATLTANTGTGWVDLQATKAADANYNAITSATVRVNFATAAQAVLTLNASTSQGYGTSQTLSTSGGSGTGAVSYAIVGQSAAGVATLSGATLTANSSSGWVTVQATRAADSNYSSAASSTVQVNFATSGQATLTLNAATPQTYGTNQTLSTSGGSGTGAVSYAIVGQSAAGVATVSGATLTANTGTGWVDLQATKAVDTNYNAITSVTVRVNFATTAQAVLTLNVATPQTFGASQTLSTSGGSGTGAVSYAIVGQSAAGVATLSGATLTANTGTGWVDLQATKAADANNNTATSAAVRVNFATAAQAVLTLNAATPQTYAASQTLSTSGGSGTGAVSYAIAGQSAAGVATLSGATLTANTGTGWVDLQATKAADVNYNAITSATVRVNFATAAQAALTLSANATLTFGTAETMTNTGGSGTGAVSYAIAGQSTAGVATLSGTTLTAAAGTGWVDLTATKAGDSNYNSVTSNTVRVTLAKASATIALGGLHQTYDGTAKSVSVTTTPGSLTTTVTYNGSSTAPSSVGSYPVVATISDSNYTGSASGSLVIDPIAQTVTISPATPTIEYGQSVTLTASGGQTGYVWGGTASGTTSSVTLTPNAGTYSATLYAPATANYLQSNTATSQVTVNKAAPTGAFAGKTVNGPYTVTAADLNAVFTNPNNQAVAPATPTYSVTAGTVLNAGTTLITATYPSTDPNYQSASVTATFIVNKTTPTLSWSPAAIRYGDPVGTQQLNATAPVAGSFQYTPSTGTPAAPLGTLALTTVFTPTDGLNYNTASASASISVTQGQQTINFPAIPAHTYLDAPFALSATASSGLPVSYSVSDSTKASVSNGSILTILGAGTVTITATQGGNANFQAASSVSQTLTINKASQTINFPDPLSNGYALLATSSSGLLVTYTSTNTSAASIGSYPATDPNVRPISMLIFTTNTPGQWVSVTASQAGDANYNAAPDVTSAQIATGQDDAWLTYPPSTLASGSTQYPLRYSASHTYNIHFEYRLEPSGTWQSFGGGYGGGYRALCSGGIDFPSAGTYSIRVMSATSQGGDATEINTARLTINVLNGGQVITFPPIPVQGVGADVSLAATASSGLAVSYAITGGTAQASVNGSTIHVSSKGSIVVKASQAGNSQYAAARDVTQQFLAVDPPKLNVDSISAPASGSTTGNLTGSGWALDALDGAPITVQLVIDGTAMPPATVTNGGSRPDIQSTSVANGWSSKDVTNCGWTFTYNVGLLYSGTHSFFVRATNSQGVSTVSSTNTFTGGSTLKPQTITFASIANKSPGDPAFAVSATASSGLPVTCSVLSGPATISGNTVTLGSTSGVVTIRASQAGDGSTYGPAPNVDQSFMLGTGGTAQLINQYYIPVNLTATAQGTGTATVTVAGTTYNLTFAPTGGQQWSVGYVPGSGVQQPMVSASLGLNYPVQVTSSGVTNLIVKATFPPSIDQRGQFKVRCGGTYANAITQAEMVGNSFNLSVVAAGVLPFAAMDMSRFEVQSWMEFGLGTGPTGETAGLFTGFSLIPGPGLLWSWQNSTNSEIQVKAPAGYADLIISATTSSLRYYPVGSYPFNGQSYDFSGATPLVTYTLSTAGATTTLTRSSGGVTTVLEWDGSASTTETPTPHNFDPYTGPGGGQVETWIESTTITNHIWSWRTPGTARGGVTERVQSTYRSAVRYTKDGPTTPPVWTKQPVRVILTRHLGAAVTDPVASVEQHDFPTGDDSLAAEAAVSYGTGGDYHQGQSHVSDTSGYYQIAPITDGNGLGTGGGSYTLFYSALGTPGSGNNLGSQPGIAAGEIKTVSQNFADYPLGDAHDLVTTYSYGSNLVDGKAMPSSSTSVQGSTTIGYSSFNYSTGTLNGLTTITSTVTTQTSSNTTTSPSITKTLNNFSRRIADPNLRNAPVAVTNPDGSKVSYGYQYGTLSGSTWTANPSGPHLLTVELRGKTGSSITSYGGITIDALDMDATRSTVTEHITDGNGQVLREANYVYTGGTSFSPLTAVYYGYTQLGALLMKADQPITVDGSGNSSSTGRVFYQATYNGWRKASETDEQGVRLNYTYDDYDRVYTLTRTGAISGTNTIADAVTTYYYDQTGRLTSEVVSAGSETSLTTSYTYDTGNRPKTKTAPGSIATSIVYDSAVQSTTTLPGGGTKTEAVYLDGRTKSVTGSGVVNVATAYSMDATTGNRVTSETAAGAKITTTTTDWIGRAASASNATYSNGTRTVSNTYNALGQLVSQDTLSGATKLMPTHLYGYDAYGRLQFEALHPGTGTTIDVNADFQVKGYEFAYQQGAPGYTTSDWYRYDGQKVYPYSGANSGAFRYVSQSYAQLSGLTATTVAHAVSLDFDRNKSDSTSTLDRANRLLTVSTTATGTSQTVQTIALDGLSISATNAQGQTTTRAYDALGRLKTSTDPRIGDSTVAYWPGTTLVKTSTPKDGRATTYGYDGAGRVTSQTDSAGKMAYFQYDGAGNLTHHWGDTVNPIRNEYNGLFQKTVMHTYQTGTGWTGSTLPTDFSGAGNLTNWSYQGSTGLLITKTDANSAAYHYEYNELDQMNKRTDARTWVTTYSYNSLNLLQTVHYTDGVTTDVVRGYDRTGKLTSVTDAAGSGRSFTYNETWSDNSYENDLQNKSARLKSETLPAGFYGPNNVLNYGYQYLAAGRANGAATSVQIGSGSAYGVAYGYDDRLRLASVTYNNGTAFSYAYLSNANLIDTVSQGNGYYRKYEYRTDSNRLDKVKHSWGSVSASQMESRLDYDLVGRRDTEKTLGSGYMTALGRSADPGVHFDYLYTDRSELNYSAKFVLPSNWLVGGPLSNTRQDYTFDAIGNRLSDEAGSYTPNILNQYTATPGHSSFSYDANGNMTGDGVRGYSYDAENRLVGVAQGASTWNYIYDYLGRRIQKSGSGIATAKYLYDGWNVVAELDASGNIVRRFAWGLDISGTLAGSGGVGGLLLIDTGSAQYWPTYDASHNVIALFNSGGGFAAAYEFDPFGNLQNAQGSYAAANPFRSATKFTDAESGLVYYGMRYYNPSYGRFINCDPIEEAGGANLYAFCGNDGVNRHDLLGMDDKPIELTPFVVTAPRTTDADRQWDQTKLDQALQSQLDSRAGTNRLTLEPCIRCHGVDAMGFHGDVTDFKGIIGMDPRLATLETRIIAALGPRVLASTHLMVAVVLVPGVGEVVVVCTIADPNAAGWEKALAAASLGVSGAIRAIGLIPINTATTAPVALDASAIMADLQATSSALKGPRGVFVIGGFDDINNARKASTLPANASVLNVSQDLYAAMQKANPSLFDRLNAQILNGVVQRGDTIMMVSDPAAHALRLDSFRPGLSQESRLLNLELPMLQEMGVVPVKTPTPATVAPQLK